MLFFQLLIAVLLGYVLQKLINRKFDEKIIKNGTLITLGIALIVAITKNSLPFAVLAAAAILLIGIKSQKEGNSAIALFLLAAIGVGCGVGSVVQTVIGAVVLVLVLLFLPLKDEA